MWILIIVLMIDLYFWVHYFINLFRQHHQHLFLAAILLVASLMCYATAYNWNLNKWSTVESVSGQFQIHHQFIIEFRSPTYSRIRFCIRVVVWKRWNRNIAIILINVFDIMGELYCINLLLKIILYICSIPFLKI